MYMKTPKLRWFFDIGINLLISKNFWKTKKVNLKRYRYFLSWRWYKWPVYPARKAMSIRLELM